MSEANRPTPESADEFARAWMAEDATAIQRRLNATAEYAKWLADFAAKSMATGIRIGREWEQRKAGGK